MKKTNTINNENISQITQQEFNSLDFRVSVHTLTLKSDQCILDESAVNSKPYMSKPLKFSKGKASFCINPNKYHGEAYVIDTLAEFEKTMKLILEELYIENFKFSRVDIAIDSKQQYERCYKINLFTSELYAAYKDNSETCKNFHENLKSSIYSGNRDFCLAIYDKNLETKGKNLFHTRFEARFLRLKKDSNVKKLVEQLINILSQLPNYIEKANLKVKKYLLNQYNIERNTLYESRTLSLSEFVSKWSYDIFNKNILYEIYTQSHYGKLKSWLWRYKRNGRNLTLYTKSDIKMYTSAIIKSLKSYCKVAL